MAVCLLFAGGGKRIRTSVGVSRRFYRPLPLAARASRRKSRRAFSARREHQDTVPGSSGRTWAAHPERFSFPCRLAYVSPRPKTQRPRGIDKAPMTTRAPISPHSSPSPAPSRIADLIPSSA